MSKEAAEYMRKCADADYKKAREKVPGLRWGTDYLLIGNKACVQGAAFLAACGRPERIESEQRLLGRLAVRHGLGKMFAPVGSKCPGCSHHLWSDYYYYWVNEAHQAVSHVNDVHGPLRKVRRILRRWARQEVTHG